MRSTSGTKKENRASIAGLASESLAEHRIIPEQTEGPVRMWYCGKPGTGIYSYRVIAAPGMLLVYGDVGDYMLQAYDRDLIPWLRGAIKSEDYLISKMINKHEVFLPDEALALLDRLVDEAKEYDNVEGYDKDEDDEDIIGMHTEAAFKLKREVLDEWDPYYQSDEHFAEAFYSAGGEVSLLQAAVDYESGVYWTVECLKKFVELLDTCEEPEETICSSIAALTEDE